ncbi:MAG: hypothetical protein GVY36_08615 [Verrucomicrobia bacterium]|jgi:hypothetical protein|nr:hypothetical protein [Verrucomicrobiota bacterium]
MGKRKSKKRKNKLARPPKRRSRPAGVLPPFPVDSAIDYSTDDDADFMETDAGYLDAPPASPRLPKKKQAFGSVDLSLYESIRYQKFRDSVAALRKTLPETVETFATYNLPNEKDRRWLTRYCIKKEEGTLPGWQQVILEKAGFNWVRGYGPRSKNKKGVRRGPDVFELRWQAAYDALLEACASQKTPMLGLLHCDETHYTWLRRQITALRAGKLKEERLEKLWALPFDFDTVLNDQGFTRWRQSFRAYAAGDLPNRERWVEYHAKARKAGKLAQWRIDALDTLDFDWTVASKRPRKAAKPKKPKVDPQKAMEARWRKRLDEYCAAKARYRGSGPLPLHFDKSLRPWISRMRMLHNQGKLRPEIVDEFKSRGFDFDGKAGVNQSWHESFEKLRAFKKKFGHLRVPSSYCDDPDLGKWLANQQEGMRKKKLKPEKLRKLKALGVTPRQRVDGVKSKRVHISPWLKTLREIEAILEKEYGGRLPEVGQFPERLRVWMRRQIKNLEGNRLEPWQVERLNRIGFDPNHLPEPPPQVDWADRLARLRRFVEKQGHAHVPRSCEDKKLVAFIENIRDRKRRGKLNRREISELRAAGFVFSPNREVSPRWRALYAELKAYYEAHGDSHVPRFYKKNQPLAEFVAQQRQRGRKGLLLAEHIRLLDELDFRWVGEHPVGKDTLGRD